MIINKTRNTAETQLTISLADDHRENNINTGVGFLDHIVTSNF